MTGTLAPRHPSSPLVLGHPPSSLLCVLLLQRNPMYYDSGERTFYKLLLQ